METFSALLALGVGNSPVTGELPSQRPVTRSFDVFFDLRITNNGLVNNRYASDLRRRRAHYDITVLYALNIASVQLEQWEITLHRRVHFMILMVYCGVTYTFQYVANYIRVLSVLIPCKYDTRYNGQTVSYFCKAAKITNRLYGSLSNTSTQHVSSATANSYGNMTMDITDITGLILGMCPANERRRYKVTLMTMMSPWRGDHFRITGSLR